jgi:predicted AlkP superfamily pyrophosphatase or phosphodiesterase
MKKIFLLLFISSHIFAQTPTPANAKPKLIVGIVVDQMRNDFIYRYWNSYGNGGFKRLVNEGYYFKNTHYNYIPTYTGPGHSSIYTGTTPRHHGIISNEWFVKGTEKPAYCVFDKDAIGAGCTNDHGKMSPKNQLSSTIGDEMKMSSNGKAKVFAVALKDRSAVLPAGHAANGAFWFDDESGNFVSSNWYMKELPKWISDFNAKKLTEKYLSAGWNTLAPIETYTNSIADDNGYEEIMPGKESPVFPYDFKTQLEKKQFGVIKSTPFGNSLTKDLAIECIRNEELGKDAITDFFSVSFSSTDIVAHAVGPRAVEIEDVYRRLDKDLEEFLNFLDKQVGKGNYTLFLTADHGGADVPKHLMDNKIPAGNISEKKLALDLKGYFDANYNDSTILMNVSSEQVFLNESRITAMKLNVKEVEQKLCAYLLTVKGISEAYPSDLLKFGSFEKNDMRALLQNGYNHRLSGNVAFVFKPGWMDHAEKGTTHGAGYNYDTHVTLIFFGNGIKKGNSFEYITITQIAPTVCELIQVNQPNSTTAQPLNGFFK